MNRTFSLITKAQMGDKHSEETLINENMPLVHRCVRALSREGYEYDDLLQLGCIGLIKAIRRFNVDLGLMFSTYAVPLISGEIKRFIRDDGIIKVSRSLKETKQKVIFAQRELSQKNNREPTISEISEHTGIALEKIVMALDACSTCESLQKPLSNSDASSLILADTIDDSHSFSDELERIALKSALGSLKPRDRQIIILRYFKGKTQSEVSKIIGVSQVQISRIEKKVLASLRENLE